MSRPELADRTVVVGADHAGYELKEHLRGWLRERGATVEDLGTTGPERVDYPDFAHAVARRIQSDEGKLGLLICGTGLGMSLAANRHRGVRAVACTDTYSARMARAHNDANVLCLGARVVGVGVAEAVLEAFVAAEFEEGRHTARVAKIDAVDSNQG